MISVKLSKMVGCLLLAQSFLPVFAAPPASFKVGEFTFIRPVTWEWVEVTSPMRKAQLRIIEPATKETADVIFFDFGPGAGGTQANVDRWLNQFEEPREKLKPQITEVTVGGRKVTYVQAQGSFKGGTPGGPAKTTPNFGLLGAIIEGKESSVFVKLTGPAVLAQKAVPEFKKMVESPLK